MRTSRKHRRFQIGALAALIVGLGSLASATSSEAAGQGRSATARGSSRGSTSARGPSRGGAGVTRSRGGSGIRSPRGRGGHSNRGHHSRGRHHGFGHGRGFGLSLGYYGGYGSYYYRPYYYRPYYHYYPSYYSYERSRNYEESGGLDFDIRPKRTEVWVDGQYVGLASKFDGFPGHLWLEKGRHELIFYRDGFETIRREVNVLPGVVLDIVADMEPGESTAAEELTVFDPEELKNRYEEAANGIEGSDGSKAAWLEPGRLEFVIEPADASVYLDGRFLGTGGELDGLRAGLMVKPGEHLLEVVRPGFEAQEISLSVEPGEETTVDVSLVQTIQG